MSRYTGEIDVPEFIVYLNVCKVQKIGQDADGTSHLTI